MTAAGHSDFQAGKPPGLNAGGAAATPTERHGRGCPIVGEDALERVRRAYSLIGGAVRLYSDEDAYFVSADCQKGDTPTYAEGDSDEGEVYDCGLDDVSDDIANDEAEAVRLWWNLYGWCASDEDGVIYCDGQGPDGIGGFTPPEDED